MVGVELRETYVQIRKANGDILQARIKNSIGPWQAGKFMDLRVADISFITSRVKSLLMADQLEKPDEMVLYRQASYGGLGLHHVKIKGVQESDSTILPGVWRIVMSVRKQILSICFL